MQPELKGVEIEPPGCRDDDLAIYDAVIRQVTEDGVVDVGKVAVERP